MLGIFSNHFSNTIFETFRISLQKFVSVIVFVGQFCTGNLITKTLNNSLYLWSFQLACIVIVIADYEFYIIGKQLKQFLLVFRNVGAGKRNCRITNLPKTHSVKFAFNNKHNFIALFNNSLACKNLFRAGMLFGRWNLSITNITFKIMAVACRYNETLFKLIVTTFKISVYRAVNTSITFTYKAFKILPTTQNIDSVISLFRFWFVLAWWSITKNFCRLVDYCRKISLAIKIVLLSNDMKYIAFKTAFKAV